MPFNSFSFILIYLPILIITYQLSVIYLDNKKLLPIILFVSSCIFIHMAGVFNLLLLLFSLATNIGFLQLLASSKDERKRKYLLILGVAFNLGFIGVFKYADLAIGTFNYSFGTDFGALELLLPLAISFYTFQLIALLVDFSKGDIVQPSMMKMSLFVSFFPQLIAGPIVRYNEVERELGGLRRISLTNFLTGTSIFFVGLFKKSVIADSLAPIANKFFGAVENGLDPSFFEAWVGVSAYTFQIYFDFSGYSDMAIGLAMIFGIKLPINFYSPYKATSIIEFWKYWHMTLSRFLRDYLYIPLGGNKGGYLGRWRNVFVTMLLGGLWHGASWNFVLWGGVHGLFIAVNHMFRRTGMAIPRFFSWAITFFALSLTWVLFRTTEVQAAGKIFSGMFGLNGIVLPKKFASIFGQDHLFFGILSFDHSDYMRFWIVSGIFCAAFIALRMPNTAQIFLERKSDLFSAKIALFSATVGVLGLLNIFEAVEFVYFRF
jgi:alginate O-acetyltransferase complex protein AlgI